MPVDLTRRFGWPDETPDFQPALRARKAAGLTPAARLKARTKLLWSQYPSASAMASMLRRLFSNACLAFNL